MAHYVKAMIENLIQVLRNPRNSGLESRFRWLEKELGRLTPMELEPAHRFDFVDLSRVISNYARLPDTQWPDLERCFTFDQRDKLVAGNVIPILCQLELFDQIHIYFTSNMYPFHQGCESVRTSTIDRLAALSQTLDFYLGLGALSKGREFPFIKDAGLARSWSETIAI